MTHAPQGGWGADRLGTGGDTDIPSFATPDRPPSDTLFWSLFLTMAVFAAFGVLWIFLNWLL